MAKSSTYTQLWMWRIVFIKVYSTRNFLTSMDFIKKGVVERLGLDYVHETLSKKARLKVSSPSISREAKSSLIILEVC